MEKTQPKSLTSNNQIKTLNQKKPKQKILSSFGLKF